MTFQSQGIFYIFCHKIPLGFSAEPPNKSASKKLS